MNFLTDVLAFVNGNLTLAIPITEMALRMFPTSKPLSLLSGAASVLHTVAGIFEGLDGFLNKVVPQQIATPAAK
jgi:hypothetical protein